MPQDFLTGKLVNAIAICCSPRTECPVRGMGCSRQPVLPISLEGTFTNVLNHTNLGDPNVNIASPSFGLINNTIGSDFGGARSGQVSARLDF